MMWHFMTAYPQKKKMIMENGTFWKRLFPVDKFESFVCYLLAITRMENCCRMDRLD